MLDLPLCFRAAGVPAFGPHVQVSSRSQRHLGVAGRDGIVGQVGGDELQVERALLADVGSSLDGAGVAGEPPGLLGAAPE